MWDRTGDKNEDLPKITDHCHRIFSEDLPKFYEDFQADISYSKADYLNLTYVYRMVANLNHIYTFYNMKESHRSRFYS